MSNIDIDLDLNSDSIQTDVELRGEVVNTDIQISAGGTSDYNGLINKPSINNIVLEGDKTLEELGCRPLTNDEIDEFMNS